MPDGMTRPMLPAVESFIADMRKLYEEGVPETDRWERCRELLAVMIADPDVQAHAQAWPVTGFNPKTDKVSNLLFYEDPDYGFVINALIKNPGGYAMIHDHGPSWTIYGVLQGEERIVHYDAAQRDDGKFDLSEKHAEICKPGDVDVVPPRLIHSEYAGAEKSIAVIVRSQRSGTFEQFRYLEDGSQVIIRGPDQEPYGLA
jgi:predicted metal-dependent enzyme (double-stranded beta helix superfamily)